MRALVTGGSAYKGSNAAEALVRGDLADRDVRKVVVVAACGVERRLPEPLGAGDRGRSLQGSRYPVMAAVISILADHRRDSLAMAGTELP